MLIPFPVPQEPTSLAEPVDWMAWPHAELYRMVHSGADAARAEHAAERWAEVARELHDVVERLGRAVGASEAGWQGEAATRAREGMRTVLDWAMETVVRAERVRHAIHSEADHLQWARATMPEPVPGWHGGDCAVIPPEIMRRRIAAPVVAVAPRQQADAAHREAAEVMARFQHGSSEVGETIPAFAAPVSPVIVYGGPETTVPSGGTSGPGGTSENRGGGVVSGPGSPRPVANTETRAPVVGQESTQAATPAEQRAQPQQQSPAARSGGMGGMGAGGGAQREEDREHRTPAYLQEDSNIFTSDVAVAPSVLGANDRD